MKQTDNIWKLIVEQLFYRPTRMIYDFAIGKEAEDVISFLPTLEEMARCWPNPSGWSTGMEDCMISGGVMLEAVIYRYQATGDESLRLLAQELFAGLSACAHASEMEGYLPRGISPIDGKAHYPNSSRDQYTHWIYAARLYAQSPLCSDGERADIARVLVGFARKAERDVRPENNWTLLREDGVPAMVTEMWGRLGPHEYLRLPMIYLAAWEASRDPHWREMYLAYRDAGISCSEKLTPDGISTYGYLQMQYSVRLLWELEEGEVRERLHRLMKRAADYTEAHARSAADILRDHPERVWHQLALPWQECEKRYYDRFVTTTPPGCYNPMQCDEFNRTFYIFQNIGSALMAQGLCPDRPISAGQREILRLGIEAYDTECHRDRAAVALIGAWWLVEGNCPER